jgi:hypothetical protein
LSGKSGTRVSRKDKRQQVEPEAVSLRLKLKDSGVKSVALPMGEWMPVVKALVPVEAIGISHYVVFNLR